MSMIEIGKIVNVRGIKGEVKVVPWVDDIELFSDLDGVYIDKKYYEIKSVKYFKNNVMLLLDGVDSIEKAELYRNKIIMLPEEDLPELEENEFYVKDLLGANVVTESGENLGEIIDVFKTGSNDVYTVKKDGKNIYLPAIKDVVKNIDIENKIITVELMEGLID
ncbi:MAG: 16S rRNA processing protein RimM [Clostridia bacterium]|nr:16S rRNA processing protein RimM [Clostridia bacterium]